MKLNRVTKEYSPILDTEIYEIAGCQFVFAVEPEKRIDIEALLLKKTGKYIVTVSIFGNDSMTLSRHKTLELARKAMYKRVKLIGESIMAALPELKESING